MPARLADCAPAFCAACFQAKPDSPHVDLGAAYDGPVLVDAAGVPQSIDDLIVCEDCIAEAAGVLALRVAPLEQIERQLAAAEAEAGAWQEYAESLEATHARRPEPPKRGPGRPPRRVPRPEVGAA